MKRKLLLSALALIAVVGIAVWLVPQAKTTPTRQTQKTCFVDANNNGICDKHEDGTCKKGNGKGLKDGSGRGQAIAQGRDKGNCNGCCKGNGRNAGQGLRDGSGQANGGRNTNFTDDNNNGVCDRKEAPATK